MYYKSVVHVALRQSSKIAGFHFAPPQKVTFRHHQHFSPNILPDTIRVSPLKFQKKTTQMFGVAKSNLKFHMYFFELPNAILPANTLFRVDECSNIQNSECKLPNQNALVAESKMKLSEYTGESFRIQVWKFPNTSWWIQRRTFPNKAAKASKKTLQDFLKTTWNIFRIKVAEYKLKCFRIRRWPPLGAQTVMLHEFDDLERDLHGKTKHC